MAISRNSRYGNDDEHVTGGPGPDHIDGGRGSDYLQGGEGPDTFIFHRGDGRDYVLDFHPGEDHIHIYGSIRQISFRDTSQGIEVYYGQFGQNGPDHFLVADVHHLTLGDFIF